jgi:pantoate--beta-alanine ligase
MLIFKDHKSLVEHLVSLRLHQKTIGFVPTMGALHEGHISLMIRAASETDQVVVSIFVNPTQFNNPEDLEKYPRTLERDLAILDAHLNHVIVYTPEPSDIYGSQIQSTFFDFEGLEHQMEGKFRPGHFDGVGTVVSKLFEIIRPHNAYFGEKDFQQLQIIRKLVQIKKLPVHIVLCPVSREENGLAMSSRNERLSPQIRKEAAIIYKTLLNMHSKSKTASVQELKKDVIDTFENHPYFTLEYIEIAEENSLIPTEVMIQNNHYRAFIAVFADNVRLIDTISLK